MVIKYPWFTVEMIDDATYAISEYGHWENAHSYLLIGNTYAALIDTGLGIGNIKSVTDQLTSLPIKVITTHVHWDHIGGHSLFKEIYVHQGDADWLEHGLPLPLARIRADVLREPFSKPAPPVFDISLYTPYRGKPAFVLADNDTFRLGRQNVDSSSHARPLARTYLCL